MVDAIILAGEGKNIVEDLATKALIVIHGKPMIEYVIDSLKGSGCIDRIVIVGPKGPLCKVIGQKVDMIIESEGTIINNLKRGMEFLNCEKHVVACTCDIPMVSAEAIKDFIDCCMEVRVDIGYPIIDKCLNDIKYPDVKRTYVKLKDGIYTGGNIVYINPFIMKDCYEAAIELVGNRKNPLKMARFFGFSILFKLFMGFLSVADVEKRVVKLFGISARAIKTSYPEIGNDVDKIDDIDFVNRNIKNND